MIYKSKYCVDWVKCTNYNQCKKGKELCKEDKKNGK